MKITSPAQYSGVHSELIYNISEADPAESIDALIQTAVADSVKKNDETFTTVGQKRYAEQTEYQLNASGYIASSIDVQPVAPSQPVELSLASQRAVRARVVANGQASEATLLTAGIKGKDRFEALSDVPLLTLAPDEIDEIVLVEPRKATALAYHTIRVAYAVNANDMNVAPVQYIPANNATQDCLLHVGVKFTADYLKNMGGVYHYLTLSVRENQDVPYRELRRYKIVKSRPEGSLRLGWINPYGAIDYYTFTKVGAPQIEIEKNRAYTAAGYETFESSQIKTQRLGSDYETARTLEWLAQILASPRVWACGADGTFTPVDVTTQAVQLDTNVPARLEIAIRDTKKTTLQKI